MATKRMILSAIWEDEWFGQIDYFQQALWIGLFSKCADDQGRILYNPILIRASIFPYKDPSAKEIGEAIESFAKAGKIIIYTSKCKGLIQIVAWWKNQTPQWANPSIYEPPDDWTDHIRTRQGGKFTQINWFDKPNINGAPIPDEPVLDDTLSDKVEAQPYNDTLSDNGVGHVSVSVPISVSVPVPVSVPIIENKNIMIDIIRRMEDMLGLSAGNRDRLNDNIEEYGEAEVGFALDAAFETHAYNWKYIEKVLSNRKAGISPPGKGNGSGGKQTQHVSINTRWT